jgi:hypothetical protein
MKAFTQRIITMLGVERQAQSATGCPSVPNIAGEIFDEE